jgi:hypothetical protein
VISHDPDSTRAPVPVDALKPFWCSSSQKRSARNTGDRATQVEFVIRPLDGATPQKVVRKRGVIALREAEYSLEEIAIEIGSSRLTVFTTAD